MEGRTKAITIKTLADQDWKTQLARKYPNIPEGVIVDVMDKDFTNYYGNWAIVFWRNTRYYVDKSGLNYNFSEEDENPEVKEILDRMENNE